MTRIPSKINLHKQSQQLELHFGAERFLLPAEYLRVHSPSAEVKGHGKAVLQFGKQDVKLIKLERAGNYALKLVFDDGHETGIYSWDYLYELGRTQTQRWDDYIAALHAAGKSRSKDAAIVRFIG